MVIDSSAILAILFDEPHAAWCAQQLDAHPDSLVMSTVNLAECIIRLVDRYPARNDDAKSLIASLGLEFIAPDATQAELAAHARLRFPINLGDCFAYALARVRREPLLATDHDFAGVDIPTILPPRKK